MHARTKLVAVASLLLLAAGCGHVSVTDSGTGRRAAARPAGCTIEFFRAKAPESPFDELGTLHWEGTLSGASAAQEAIRDRACQLGADAVIVTRDYVPYTQNTSGFMTATAIKFRATAPDGGK